MMKEFCECVLSYVDNCLNYAKYTAKTEKEKNVKVKSYIHMHHCIYF